MVATTRLERLKQTLAGGGSVRYNIRTGNGETVDGVGQRQPLDRGRLDILLALIANFLVRSETTSEATKDMVIEWTLPKK